MVHAHTLIYMICIGEIPLGGQIRKLFLGLSRVLIFAYSGVYYLTHPHLVLKELAAMYYDGFPC